MLCFMLVGATNILLYFKKYQKIARVALICVPVHSQKYQAHIMYTGLKRSSNNI